VYALIAGLLVTFLFAPTIRSLMLRGGVLDVPNHRSSHSIPTPRGGGLACLVGIAAATGAAVVTGQPIPVYALAGCLLLAVLGFADDRKSLPAMPRILGQVAAGATLGGGLGGPWGVAIGVILVPGVVNVVNFMDGINGITSLTMTLWGATAVLVGHVQHVPTLSLLGVLSAGSALGFLPWNAPVARLFLGDAGSYLFGGLAAAGLIAAWFSGASVLAVGSPLALYVLDTAWVLFKRARRGARLTEAHREHTYQRLTAELGLPHWVVSVGVLVLSLAITASWAFASWWFAAALTLVVGVAYLTSPSALPQLAPPPTSPSRQSVRVTAG
jgi:UDP-N-acetylmuramyl pentapeptide phosphotransferase/UDP-N-acetylglucosamine-1-phosphate transferase